MKILIRVATGLGVLFAAYVLFVIVVSNFGTVESRLVCSGQVQRQVGGGDQVTTPATLYALVETYRWIIFWTEHDAMITWEIQPGNDTGFGYYTRNNFGTPITDFYRQKNYGSFLPLSNRISIVTSADENEAFEGLCK